MPIAQVMVVLYEQDRTDFVSKSVDRGASSGGVNEYLSSMIILFVSCSSEILVMSIAPVNRDKEIFQKTRSPTLTNT